MSDAILGFERKENFAIREAFRHQKWMPDLIGFVRILELEVPWAEKDVGVTLHRTRETLKLKDT